MRFGGFRARQSRVLGWDSRCKGFRGSGFRGLGCWVLIVCGVGERFAAYNKQPRKTLTPKPEALLQTTNLDTEACESLSYTLSS